MGAKRNQRGRESAPVSSQERRPCPASPASHLYSLPLKAAPTFSLLPSYGQKSTQDSGERTSQFELVTRKALLIEMSPQ